MSVLKEFYDQAAEATSLIQNKQPEIFDKPYTGMQSENGGVMGMLEVIQSDFARLEAETRAAESEGADEFQRFSDESSQDKAVKSTDLDHKDKTKTEKANELNDTEKDLA